MTAQCPEHAYQEDPNIMPPMGSQPVGLSGIINRNPQGLSGIRITAFRIKALAGAARAMRITFGVICNYFRVPEVYFGGLNALPDLKIQLQTIKISLPTLKKCSRPRIRRSPRFFQLILDVAEVVSAYFGSRKVLFSLFRLSQNLFQLVLALAEFCLAYLGSRSVF